MRYIVFLFFLIAGHLCYSQSHQISFQLSSGLFSFGGASAHRTSFLNVSDVAQARSYTNNPYGRNSNFSYGLGAQFQRITRKNFIYGLQLSYESLSSQLAIDNAYGEIIWNVQDGKAVLTSDFVNLFPSVGHRTRFFNVVDTEFLVGFDLAFGLSSKEHYNVTTNQGQEISGTSNRAVPNVDFRPRIEVVAYYKHLGLSIGYSYGVTNYQANLVGANREAMARYLRFGLSYRLKQ